MGSKSLKIATLEPPALSQIPHSLTNKYLSVHLAHAAVYKKSQILPACPPDIIIHNYLLIVLAACT